MNINLLRTFATVVKTGSFRKAAAALHLSQPGVSLQMATLSQGFSLPLFNHNKNTWTLTEAGWLLYAHARTILNAVDRLEMEMNELASLQKGHLFLGATLSVAKILPGYLAEFESRHPGITYSLDVANTHDIQEEMSSWKLDLAFVEGKINAPELAVIPFEEDELVLVVPPHHPLAGQEKTTASRLVGENLILREKGSGTRELVEDAFEAHFKDFKLKLELSHTVAILAAVEAGLGISFLSRSLIEKSLLAGTVAVLEVEGVKLTRRFSLVYHLGKHLSPAANALKALVLETSKLEHNE